MLVHPVQFALEIDQLLQLLRRGQCGARSNLRLFSLAAGRRQPRASILVAAVDQHDEESGVCRHRDHDLLSHGEIRDFLLAGKTRISTSGGAQVRWRQDGKELFYLSLQGQLMAVPVGPGTGSQAIDVLAPTPLFTAPVGDVLPANSRQQYVVSPDGQRFLLNTEIADGSAPIVVILTRSHP